MGIVGLDHVQVAAPRGCEPEARRFFGELLGLVEIEKPERLAVAGAKVRWDDELAGVLYTEDPWGNRIELLAYGS